MYCRGVEITKFDPCPTEKISQFSPFCAVSYIDSFESSMKPDTYSIENSVDPDQLASKEAS